MFARNRIQRLSAVFALLGAAALAVVSCSSPDAGEEGGEGEPVETIRVAYAQGLQANFYYALERDLFADHGVQVEGTKFDSGPALVSALVSGSVDVGYFGIPAMATANAQGADLQIFSIANNAGDMAALYVDPASGIEAIEDLDGRTVATTQNTVSHIFLLIALEQAGMAVEDVSIEFLDPNAVVAGYARGDLDATYAFASVGAKLLASGAELVEGTSSTDLGVPDTGNFIASSGYIEEHTEALQRFLSAIDEATSIVNDDKAAYVEALSSGIGLADDEAGIIYQNQPSPLLLTEQLIDPSSELDLSDGGAFEKTVQKYVDIMVQLGLLSDAPDVSTFITSTVVEGMHK